MKRIFQIYIIVVLFGALAACREYVEVEPIGSSRLLKYTSDYQGLMNNTDVLKNSYSLPLIASNDVEFADSAYQYTVSDIVGNTYTWQDSIYQQGNQDTDWSNLYGTIYYCNAVIDGVLDSEGGTEIDKNEVYAQALAHRAYAYWALVNLYGAQYEVNTAANTDGVPLLLTSDLYTALTRASVEDVYAQIISDLEDAFDLLPATPTFNLMPSQVGVQAFLARIYLGMSDYDQALSYAEAALQTQGELLDLNDYVGNPYGMPAELDDPENIFYKGCTVYAAFNLPMSNDLLELLGADDLRYQLFTRDGSMMYPSFTGRGYIRNQLNATGINTGMTVPEMMLIKAECIARSGDTAGALAVIDELRAHRVLASAFVASEASSASQALRLVLDERRRELFGRGLNWFDMKRLNLEAEFATTITREYRGQQYDLAPNSQGYIFPIFEDYINLNPELGGTSE